MGRRRTRPATPVCRQLLRPWTPALLGCHALAAIPHAGPASAVPRRDVHVTGEEDHDAAAARTAPPERSVSSPPATAHPPQCRASAASREAALGIRLARDPHGSGSAFCISACQFRAAVLRRPGLPSRFSFRLMVTTEECNHYRAGPRISAPAARAPAASPPPARLAGMPVPPKRLKEFVGERSTITPPSSTLTCRKSPSAGGARSATWTPGPTRATTATSASPLPHRVPRRRERLGLRPLRPRHRDLCRRHPAQRPVHRPPHPSL